MWWLALLARPKWGPARVLRGVEAAGSPQETWDRWFLREPSEAMAGRDTARRCLEAARSEGMHVCTLDNPSYPSLLRELTDAPPVLFWRGTWPAQVAVLPCALDRVFPRIHKPLARRIEEAGGLLVSEQPPGRQVERWMFAARNRIVTGFSAATIVVQSPARGGSLISARCAHDQDRELYTFHQPQWGVRWACLLYTSPSPRDVEESRMPSSA